MKCSAGEQTNQKQTVTVTLFQFAEETEKLRNEAVREDVYKKDICRLIEQNNVVRSSDRGR